MYKRQGSHRRKASKIEISMLNKFEKLSKQLIFHCSILKDQGFVKVPGYEPIHLDLEKLFLLSVSKENLDFRGKYMKNL